MGAAFVNHRLLDRCQTAIFGVDAFDSNDVFAGGVGEWHQTRGHCAIFDVVRDKFADQNSASSAVAFAATDFRSLEIFVITHKIKHRRAGRLIGRDVLVVKYEFNHLRKLAAKKVR